MLGVSPLDSMSKTEMLAALEQFKGTHVRAVVLRSAVNEKVWSAGHDVRELPKAGTWPDWGDHGGCSKRTV
jgi:enoyl-CoA hydratase/carnithine racemase